MTLKGQAMIGGGAIDTICFSSPISYQDQRNVHVRFLFELFVLRDTAALSTGFISEGGVTLPPERV